MLRLSLICGRKCTPAFGARKPEKPNIQNSFRFYGQALFLGSCVR